MSFSYQFRVRQVADSEYKIEYNSNDSDGVDAGFLKINRHGIRVVVRQSGQIGQFALQQLLLALVSSLALLAVAKTVVQVLAFSVLPLKYIYKQYQTIETVDFSDLTDADRARFKAHDVINPHPRVGLAKVANASGPGSVVTNNPGTWPANVGWEGEKETRPDDAPFSVVCVCLCAVAVADAVAAGALNGGAGAGAGAGGGAGGGGAGAGGASAANTNTSVQERKHTTQDGFWGDLQVTYQGDWDGDGGAQSGKDWHYQAAPDGSA